MPGQVHLAIEHTLARVTLSHPGKFNAMSRAMWRELKAVFTELQARGDDLRCVAVAGEGGHFCAGGDIAEYPDFRFDEDALRDFHENEVWGGLGAMLACDLPLVAQIEGNCMGAGVEIASCCDIRVAGSGAARGATGRARGRCGHRARDAAGGRRARCGRDAGARLPARRAA
jgi:enoyl-CoA hydratase/carnithine racemase